MKNAAARLHEGDCPTSIFHRKRSQFNRPYHNPISEMYIGNQHRFSCLCGGLRVKPSDFHVFTPAPSAYAATIHRTDMRTAGR